MLISYTYVVFDIFCLCILLILRVGGFKSRKENSKSEKALINLLRAGIITIACNALSWISLRDDALLYLSFAVGAYAASQAVVFFYIEYIYAYIGRSATVSPKLVRALQSLCLLGVALRVMGVSDSWCFLYFVVETVLAIVLIPVRLYKKIGSNETLVFVSFAFFPALTLLVRGVWQTTFFYGGIVLAICLLYVMVHKRHEQYATEQQAELADYRAQIMVSQIQPHFLYNALNAIYFLIGKDPKLAQEAVSDFSDYLRMNLDSIGKTDLIDFSTELKHTKTYLWMEQLRYGDELKIAYDIGTEKFKLPPLSVQPIVENAVKHGVGKKKGGGTVTIKTREEDDFFTVTIEDDGVGFNPYMDEDPKDAAKHVGLNNVDHRIKMMCNGTMSVASSPFNGTSITIRLPKETCHL